MGNEYDAFGLFEIERDESADQDNAWMVKVLGYRLATNLTYGRALNITADLVNKATRLDANPRAFAVVWAMAADAKESLMLAEGKVVELAKQREELQEKLNIARTFLYRVKFECSQQADKPMMSELGRDANKILDESNPVRRL